MEISRVAKESIGNLQRNGNLNRIFKSSNTRRQKMLKLTATVGRLTGKDCNLEFYIQTVVDVRVRCRHFAACKDSETASYTPTF